MNQLGEPVEPIGEPIEPTCEPFEPIAEPFEPTAEPVEPIEKMDDWDGIGIEISLKRSEIRENYFSGCLNLPIAHGLVPNLTPFAIRKESWPPIEMSDIAGSRNLSLKSELKAASRTIVRQKSN